MLGVDPTTAVGPMEAVAPMKGAWAEEGLPAAGGRMLVPAGHPAGDGRAAGAASKERRLAEVGPGHRRRFLVRSDDRPSIDGRWSQSQIAVLMKLARLRLHAVSGCRPRGVQPRTDLTSTTASRNCSGVIVGGAPATNGQMLFASSMARRLRASAV